ncbi:MAG: hypothetical protein F6K40_12445 [Okeania sp. SIO3I5]|uniref:hypothetical protein n=1 Tax=Okeania sp. SIO3I5 TaxID=2607805 RepID=UPI0013BBC0AB|nr:hypothetical protein [Okeania sp. SIO3I5]NEQ37039.1 hypothetical protein [Okeania sp. SIO3I5]
MKNSKRPNNEKETIEERLEALESRRIDTQRLNIYLQTLEVRLDALESRVRLDTSESRVRLDALESREPKIPNALISSLNTIDKRLDVLESRLSKLVKYNREMLFENLTESIKLNVDTANKVTSLHQEFVNIKASLESLSEEPVPPLE